MVVLVQCFVETTSAHYEFAHHVRVHVGGGTTILQVATPFVGARARNANTGPTIGHASTEVVHGRGLVATSQSASIVGTAAGIVLDDVLLVVLLQLLDAILYLRHAALGTSALGAEIGVSSGTIPVARDQLGIECHANVKVFGHTMQEVARHPHVVANGDAFTRADLR